MPAYQIQQDMDLTQLSQIKDRHELPVKKIQVSSLYMEDCVSFDCHSHSLQNQKIESWSMVPDYPWVVRDFQIERRWREGELLSSRWWNANNSLARLRGAMENMIHFRCQMQHCFSLDRRNIRRIWSNHLLHKSTAKMCGNRIITNFVMPILHADVSA